MYVSARIRIPPQTLGSDHGVCSPRKTSEPVNERNGDVTSIGDSRWRRRQPEEVRMTVFLEYLHPFARDGRLALIPQFPKQIPSCFAAGFRALYKQHRLCSSKGTAHSQQHVALGAFNVDFDKARVPKLT